jgi:hypothetical protein
MKNNMLRPGWQTLSAYVILGTFQWGSNDSFNSYLIRCVDSTVISLEVMPLLMKYAYTYHRWIVKNTDTNGNRI